MTAFFQSNSTAGCTVAAGLLAGVLLSGCGSSNASGLNLQTPAPENTGAANRVTAPGPSGTPSPSVAPTPTSTTPPATEEQEVLAAYNNYWVQFRTLGALPSAERPAALSPVAADPLYTAVLKELDTRDATGRVGYGQIVTKPELSLLQGARAAVRDCQDTSNNGLMDKATGEKLTVGVPTFLRLSQLERGADGVWRVTEIGNTREGKC